MFGTDILQPTHLLLILLVALIVLGPKRLPEVGKSLGRGLRDFRAGISGVQDEARGMFNDVLDEPAEPVDPTDPNAALTSIVPEPYVPTPEVEPEPAAEAVPAPVAAVTPAFTTVPPVASVTKVTPVETDPADFAD